MPRALPAPRPWVQALVLVLLAVGAYWTSRDNGFFFDDTIRIIQNPGIRRLTPWTRFFTEPRLSASEMEIANYRPLLAWSLAWDYSRGGLEVTAYHDTQLATHAAATLGTWAGLGALLGPTAPGAAFWAAALFATHPVSGVAVRYISGRDLLQMQLFLMLSLGLYLHRRRQGRLTSATWAGILGLFTLSVLSKKNGMVAPALVLWIEVVLPDDSGEPPGWRTGLRRALLFAAPLVAVALVSRGYMHHDEFPMVVDPAEPLSPGYAATQLWVHVRYYLWGFLTPWTLHLEAGVPWLSFASPRAWAGALVIGASLAWAWLRRHQSPVAATCVVAYWLLMVPTSSVLKLYAPAVPYRPYPSSAFLYGLVLLGLARLRPPRGVAVAGVLVVASLASALATDPLWQDAAAVWAHSVRRGGTAKALASHALNQEDPEQRAALLRQVLEQDPRKPRTVLALSETLLRMGRREEGLDLALRARDMAPHIPGTQEVVARYLLAEGFPEEALEAARAAFRLDPQSIPVQMVMASALQQNHLVEESAPFLERVSEAAPGYGEVDLRLGYLAETRDQLDRAIEHYRRYAAKRPTSSVAQSYLGNLLFRTGRFEEAIEALEAARAAGDTSRKVDQQLWACYRQLGKSSEADEALARLRRSPGR